MNGARKGTPFLVFQPGGGWSGPSPRLAGPDVRAALRDAARTLRRIRRRARRREKLRRRARLNRSGRLSSWIVRPATKFDPGCLQCRAHDRPASMIDEPRLPVRMLTL